ncbi:ATP-dependent DNA helicase RecG [Blautia obeum]|jgi:ATP-dependent DNA helicase RecG|uniref:ATP-dependent DNA helicase RecG n=1 Tax=Blautia obeum TaxID=40520 RepID=UPI00156DD79D|nr:ATP-dependent DNA helicase RecG [Blautia obeum]NSG39735.1 ATP-dependent DNA helicase RecG [Blautia obeum]
MAQSLRTLKGVGEKTEKLFQKVGIYDTDDLLHYYPRNYDEYETPVDIAELKEETVQAVSAAVCSGVYVNSVRGRQIISVNIADQSGKFPVVWFNLPYLKKTLRKGSWFVFRGRIVRKQGKLEMEHPEIFTPSAYEEILHNLQPIYGLTAGLSNKTVVKMVTQLLETLPMQSEYLPEELKERYRLADINYALKTIHFPKNKEELLVSRKRLVFDEFLLFIISVRRMKEKAEETPNCFPVKETWLTEEVIERLPYSLTNAQLNAWHEIERDLAGRTMMSRLVQGDVGSGKTILAFLAMFLVADNGYQAALMAPTEVLARQHYEGFLKLMEEQGLSFPTVLLTGSDTAKEKRIAYERIASGEAAIIIGTHALIQEKVEYANLALVITDEQHRFGVKQREALTTRGNPPNVLVMSATPIPRTLAIILYGDLDISVIDELPAKRLPIKNCVVNTSYRPKAYSFIEKQVRQGRQAYVICPMVEESEGMDAENVLDYTQKLKENLPSDIQIEYLHGKMKPKEKNRVMESFAAGEIQVLVSTTVVEVGVNVPNATVMMVENAERFGLAQLHQLRGRVGRGEYQSYCIFIQGNQDQISKRLEILNKSNDGFYIAGEDLKLRGPGDLFGIRQSGDMEFRIGDIYNDSTILKEASEAAEEILSLDPELDLEQHRSLRERMEHYSQNATENIAL